MDRELTTVFHSESQHGIPSDKSLIIKCAFCDSVYQDPYTLPCLHAFCKTCLITKVKAGKLICALCLKETAASNLEKLIKPSNLTNFLIKFFQNEFEQIDITNDELKETDGIWFRIFD